jgi:hypothetical protein
MSQKRAHDDDGHIAGPQAQAARVAKIRACELGGWTEQWNSVLTMYLGAECKRHKIRCEPVVGEQKCSKCLKSNLECVPHNPNQKFQDEDAV